MNTLQNHQTMAARDAGLDLMVPCTVELTTGTSVTADAHLPDLGAERGMLVASASSTFAGLEEQLVGAGDSYTSYDDPRETEIYDPASYAEMFREWGWNGSNADRPSIQSPGVAEVVQVIGGFPSHQVRGPEVHPCGGPSCGQPHGHMGPVGPIPIREG